jgi:hypothetical protein
MKKADKADEPKGSVVFEEPPPRRVPRYDWAKIREQLVAHPNQWARVFEDDLTSLVTAIRMQGIVAMRADRGIEVRTTNNVREPERRCSLWARYCPDKDKSLQDGESGAG